MLTILFFVFTTIMKFEIENYPLYLLLGIILWNAFARGTSAGMSSILNRAGIIKNVYFPREVLPFSSTVTSFMMLGFEFIVFGFFVVVFGFMPATTIFLLIPIVALYFVLVLGVSFALSVLNVKFKDMHPIWTIILQAGFFLSPIIYKLEMLPENIQNILYFSPVVQILNMSYSVTLDGTLPAINDVAYTVFIIAAIFGVGYTIFRINRQAIMEMI